MLVHLAVGLVALLAVTEAVLTLGHVRLGRAPVVAIVRGAVQLAVVGVLLRGAISAPWAVAAVLAVMLTTATRTAAGRLRELDGAGPAVVLACVLGAVVALGVVFAIPVLPRSPRYVVALGGVVIGGTMTSATLAGRHLLAGLRARREEVEGWLALGATPREAVADVARSAAGEALVPALDQTRTTGLVTLPGSFIGALLGGASPTDAARFQIVVLAALLCAQAVVAVTLVHMLGAPTTLPADAAR
ncbi:putative ABC transport system permease protein [Motilibacter rhizosphaerae]|uniref:Putative ABC transport system permease protein n=1 Tax=Motilibacter rhizosphaerae TaxID=598652 RepID=A0A4Q7NAV2_9ACTN|nr:ABC transporter permease [Motilibacter rhizosphaerae]RZS79995.1 putative ABC transport system permease protein [Motilibacter rhizosphaerae]